MRYYLIAGEPSGDLHGANLMREIKELDPNAEFRFWGGELMAEVGGTEALAKDYRENSFFGLLQVIANLPTILRQMRECREDVARFKPDALILIDYPGFNMKMARWAKRQGIKTLYYIAPKVWAWGEWRVKSVRKYVDKLFVIFPFEIDFFRRKGCDPIFEGNPIVDALEKRKAELPTPEEYRAQHSLDTRPIVALLAGSRKSEIEANLPLMVATAKLFPDHQFVVTGVEWIDKGIYDKIIGKSGVKCIYNATYETLIASRAAIVTSGTATLETALLGTPEIVLYRTSRFNMLFKDLIVKVPYISLVNLNLRREAVAEILQSDLSTHRAETQLRAILYDGEERTKMLADFKELSEIIGGKGASARFAARIYNELKR